MPATLPDDGDSLEDQKLQPGSGRSTDERAARLAM